MVILPIGKNVGSLLLLLERGTYLLPRGILSALYSRLGIVIYIADLLVYLDKLLLKLY